MSRSVLLGIHQSVMPSFHLSLKASAFAAVLIPFVACGQQTPLTQDMAVAVSHQATSSAPWEGLKLDPKVRIKLSFRNANIDNVIQMLQDASQVTIAKDPSLKGGITVTTARPVKLGEAFHVFNSVLKLEGYEITRDDEILVITKFKAPAPVPTPTANATQQAQPEQPATIVDWYPLTCRPHQGYR